MANSWDTTLTALNPDHWWKLTEESGNFQDSGVIGELTLEPSDEETGNIWRLAPGLVKCEPRTNALWTNQRAGEGLTNFTGFPSANLLTGAMGAVVFFWTANDQIAYVISQTYDEDDQLLTLRYNLDQTLEFVCSTPTKSNSGKTAPIALQTAMVVMGLNRADGKGMRVYVDGIDVTVTTAFSGAGVTIDSFADDILSGLPSTDIMVGGLFDEALGGFITDNPHVFLNSVPTDAQIAGLAASANLQEVTSTDYFETVFKLVGNSIVFWMPGWVGGKPFNIGLDVSQSNNLDDTGFSGSSSLNNLETGGLGNQILSAFNDYYSIFGSPPSNSNFNSSNYTVIDSNDTVGTYIFIGKVIGAPSEGFKIITNYGEGRSVSTTGFDNAYMMIKSAGTGLYNWGFKVEAASGDFYQALSSVIAAQDTAIHMLVVVQDGTAVRVYGDGVLAPLQETSSGSTLDKTSWFAAIEALTSSKALQHGSATDSGSVENFQPNELHDTFLTRNVFSATDVSELWNAVNGQFLEFHRLGISSSSNTHVVTDKTIKVC